MQDTGTPWSSLGHAWSRSIILRYLSRFLFPVQIDLFCECASVQDLSPGNIEEAEEAEPDDEFKMP